MRSGSVVVGGPSGKGAKIAGGAAWVADRSIDPASSFEREFLDYLDKNGYRLPDLRAFAARALFRGYVEKLCRI